MLVDLQAILKELKLSAGSQFRQAQEMMNKRLRDDPNTLVCLIEILVDNHQCKKNLMVEQIKLVSSSFLNSTFVELLEEPDDNTLRKMSNYLMRILLNQRVSLSCKRNFNRSLAGLLECLSNSQIQSHGLLSQWIKLAVNIINSDADNLVVCMMMEAFSSAEVTESDFMEFVNNVAGLSIKSLTRGNKTVEQLTQWADGFYQLFEKMIEIQEQQRNFVMQHLLNEICQNQQLVHVIFNIYMMGCQEDRVLIVADSQINKLKEQVGNLHVMMIEHMYKSQKSVPFQPIHIQLLAKLLPFLVQTMLVVSRCPDERLDDHDRARDFAIQVMKMLEYCVKQIELNKLIYQESQALLLNIVLPLFRTTNSQIQKFEQQSNDYCEYANDLTDRQKIHTLKSQAASLLEAILDSVDGCTTFIFDIAVNSILKNYHIQDVNVAFSLSTEAAFMVLSIMSYMYENKRKDLLGRLRILFVQHFKIVSELTPLELTWLYIFMSYNYSDIFPEAKNGQPYILQAVYYDGHPTAQNAALQFVMGIVEHYYTEEMFKKIVDRLENSTCFTLWEIFIKYFVQNNWLLGEAPAVYLVAKLIQRISIEFSKMQKIEKRALNLTYINKCLMVLLTISRKSSYLKDKPLLETELWSICQFLQVCKRAEIVSEVLKILNELLVLRPTLLDREKQMLSILVTIQNRMEYRHIFTPISKIVNLYLFKVPALHSTEKLLLFQLCLGVLSPKMVDRQEKDYDIGLLLTQILVIKFENVICKEEIAEIQRILGEVKKKICKSITKCTLLNLKILMYPIELRMGLKTQNFTTELLGLEEEYRMQYDRRVLIFGLCRCLFIETDFLSVGEMLNVSARTLENYKECADDEKFESRHDEQHKKSLIRLKSDWHHFDVFGHFQQIIAEMQKNNSKMFRQLFDTLTSDVKEMLKEISKIKTIHNTPRKFIKVNKNNVRQKPLSLSSLKTDRHHELLQQSCLNGESSEMEEEPHDKKFKKVKL